MELALAVLWVNWIMTCIVGAVFFCFCLDEMIEDYKKIIKEVRGGV